MFRLVLSESKQTQFTLELEIKLLLGSVLFKLNSLSCFVVGRHLDLPSSLRWFLSSVTKRQTRIVYTLGINVYFIIIIKKIYFKQFLNIFLFLI